MRCTVALIEQNQQFLEFDGYQNPSFVSLLKSYRLIPRLLFGIFWYNIWVFRIRRCSHFFEDLFKKFVEVLFKNFKGIPKICSAHFRKFFDDIFRMSKDCSCKSFQIICEKLRFQQEIPQRFLPEFRSKIGLVILSKHYLNFPPDIPRRLVQNFFQAFFQSFLHEFLQKLLKGFSRRTKNSTEYLTQKK